MGFKRILVVDDDADLRESLTLCLTDAGFDVYGAADGATAIACYDAVAPEVVLLDFHLPDLDGSAVALALRGRPVGDRVTIVVHTGGLVSHADLVARGVDVDAVLRKPFAMASLADRLRDARRTRLARHSR